MGKEDRRESFLVNLGRATRRGVRQCKKCGTLNGTRGYSCKNKSCDVVFKEAGEKRKLSTEACKIITGNETQIYSVRVRDKGPDYRGFVQLDYLSSNNNTSSNNNVSSGSTQCFSNPFDGNDPLSSNSSFSSVPVTSSGSLLTDLDGGGSGISLRYSSTGHFDASLTGGASSNTMQDGGGLVTGTNNLDGMGDLSDASLMLTQPSIMSSGSGAAPAPVITTAHCFVESCSHKLAKQPMVPKGSCAHIKAASQCFKNSESVMLKSSVLNSMPLHPELKTEIWQLATTTPGPLVQRVSKNIMVVKCQSDALHPLGFLHFSFQTTRSLRDGSIRECGKYFCSCRAFKTSGNLLKDVLSLRVGGGGGGTNRDLVPMRSCIHLYACLLALASHPNLAHEFAQYIALITGEESRGPGCPAAPVAESGGGTAMEDDEEPGTVKIQVTDEDEDDTTAYIRVSEAGSCPGDDELGGERSFLILNDGSNTSCQVEVEVLPRDTALLHAAIDHHQQQQQLRGSRSSLVTQDDLDGKLEIQLHTNEEGGVELCTADGGSISVHPCVSASVHQHQHLTTISSSAPNHHQHNQLHSSSTELTHATATTSYSTGGNLNNNNIINSHTTTINSNGVAEKHEDFAVTQASSALMTLHNTAPHADKKRPPFRVQRRSREPVDEGSANLPFSLWLAGATERINHTMQYTQPGRPQPLVFHVPRSFFECLLERIQNHSRKKIPAIQTSVPNTDPSVPGKQTRYAWHLFNLAHLKTIFHTPHVSLQTTRSFLVNRNGTYHSYQPPVDQQALSSSRGTSSQPHIRPQEYRTVLRVGISAYQPAAKPTPFIIEWIPDVFPLSKLGELRIKFEYEHIHNGHPVRNIAFREVLTTAPASGALNGTTVLQSPVIINSTSTGQPHMAASKPLTPVKSGPPPIAPKLAVLSTIKDTPIEEVNGTILDISLHHDTFVDSDGYTTLLF